MFSYFGGASRLPLTKRKPRRPRVPTPLAKNSRVSLITILCMDEYFRVLKHTIRGMYKLHHSMRRTRGAMPTKAVRIPGVDDEPLRLRNNRTCIHDRMLAASGDLNKLEIKPGSVDN